jgi:hypothetical protein
MGVRRYPIPTHLTVEPSLIRAEFGPIPVDLTFRQATALACAAGFAYWLWQGSGLPVGLVVPLALLALTVAIITAFVTVGGRSADLWLRDLLHYAVRPHRLVWRADGALPALYTSPTVGAGPPLILAWAPTGSAETPTYPAPAAD